MAISKLREQQARRVANAMKLALDGEIPVRQAEHPDSPECHAALHAVEDMVHSLSVWVMYQIERSGMVTQDQCEAASKRIYDAFQNALFRELKLVTETPNPLDN